jgi:hypothetical protein
MNLLIKSVLLGYFGQAARATQRRVLTVVWPVPELRLKLVRHTALERPRKWGGGGVGRAADLHLSCCGKFVFHKQNVIYIPPG